MALWEIVGFVLYFWEAPKPLIPEFEYTSLLELIQGAPLPNHFPKYYVGKFAD